MTMDASPMTKETISTTKEMSSMVKETPFLVMEMTLEFKQLLSVAARRQTAAIVSALFQMAALCQDAATPIADVAQETYSFNAEDLFRYSLPQMRA